MVAAALGFFGGCLVNINWMRYPPSPPSLEMYLLCVEQQLAVQLTHDFSIYVCTYTYIYSLCSISSALPHPDGSLSPFNPRARFCRTQPTVKIIPPPWEPLMLDAIRIGGGERERQKSRARKVIHLCCALTTWGEIVQLGRGEENETKKRSYTTTIYSPRSNGNDFILGSAAASAVRLLASIDISVLVMPISLDTAKASSTSTNIWQTDVPKNATPFMQDDCQEIFLGFVL